MKKPPIRAKLMSIRVTDEEHSRYLRRAKAAGVSVSTFVRETLAEGDRRGLKALRERVEELEVKVAAFMDGIDLLQSKTPHGERRQLRGRLMTGLELHPVILGKPKDAEIWLHVLYPVAMQDVLYSRTFSTTLLIWEALVIARELGASQRVQVDVNAEGWIFIYAHFAEVGTLPDALHTPPVDTITEVQPGNVRAVARLEGNLFDPADCEPLQFVTDEQEPFEWPDDTLRCGGSGSVMIAHGPNQQGECCGGCPDCDPFGDSALAVSIEQEREAKRVEDLCNGEEDDDETV